MYGSIEENNGTESTDLYSWKLGLINKTEMGVMIFYRYTRFVSLCFFVSLLYFGSAFAVDYKCDGPDISREQMISIVERARIIDPEFPPPLPNSKISIREDICHYSYSEINSDVGQRVSIILNRFGTVVGFNGIPSIKYNSCPNIEYSEEKMAKFLAISRNKYPDIPAPLEKYEVMFGSVGGCLFGYFEIQTKNNIRTTNHFQFDFFGDLWFARRSEYPVSKVK